MIRITEDQLWDAEKFVCRKSKRDDASQAYLFPSFPMHPTCPNCCESRCDTCSGCDCSDDICFCLSEPAVSVPTVKPPVLCFVTLTVRLES